MSDEASQTQGSTPVDPVSLAPGRMVGRYKIAAVLGHGGFGITYRARDAQLGREVVITEYLPLALAVRQDGTITRRRRDRGDHAVATHRANHRRASTV